MQNSFCHSDGAVNRTKWPVYQWDRILRETKQALASVRELAIPVVYVYTTFRPDYADASTMWRKRCHDAEANKALVEGSWDAEIVPDIAPMPGDITVVKRGFDGFLHTNLEATLRHLGVRRLLVAGVYANICVESTARTAFQLDFDVTVLTDCTGATSADNLEMAFRSLGAMFATVTPWRDALAELAPLPA
ncbi:MAG: isochorismatase family protein [Pseudonocardiaceae bacterium]|nr:isochorismatase family protein [Pseudonocardiaceae bacterium]